MSLTVAVQMDPLERINISGDSTFALMLRAQERGHKLYHYLAEALTTVATSGVPWWEAELHRLRGALLLQRSVAQPVEAEACFQQALAVACRQQARSLELRAAMSLSRLWRQQGKRAEARELLAPIYSWFTEGVDTLDLQEAKALLEELAR